MVAREVSHSHSQGFGPNYYKSEIAFYWDREGGKPDRPEVGNGSQASGWGRRLASTTETYFSEFWSLDVWDQSASKVGFLVRASFLACRWPISCCVFMWQIERKREGEEERGRERRPSVSGCYLLLQRQGPGGDAERQLDKQICSSGERGRQRHLMWSQQNGNGI